MEKQTPRDAFLVRVQETILTPGTLRAAGRRGVQVRLFADDDAVIALLTDVRGGKKQVRLTPYMAPEMMREHVISCLSWFREPTEEHGR